MRFVWVWLSEPEMASTGWTGRKGEKNKTKKWAKKNGTTKWIMELERIDADDGRKGDPPSPFVCIIDGQRF